MVTIRTAQAEDKDELLSFCTTTFSWGDYIDQVWDLWLSDLEGQLLVAESGGSKVGLAHVSACPEQASIWLEGIRVHPAHRRGMIATALLERMLAYGRERGFSGAQAIVARDNLASQSMMEKCGFKVISEWEYYSTDRPLPGDALSARPATVDDLDAILDYLEHSEIYSRGAKKYVSSWRWYQLDSRSIAELVSQGRVVVAGEPIAGIAVINKTGYWSRKNVLQIVYLDSAEKDAVRSLISFAANIFSGGRYERLQVLFPLDSKIKDAMRHLKIAESEQFLLYSKVFTG